MPGPKPSMNTTTPAELARLERRFRAATAASQAAAAGYTQAKDARTGISAADALCARADARVEAAADALRAADPVRGQEIIDRVVRPSGQQA
jgi:hypothetical protein